VAPWTCGSNLDYQKCQVRLQKEKEAVFEQAARTIPAEKVLIVCDRGVLDNKTYMNQAEGEVHMLEEVPLKYGRSDAEAATLVQIRLQEIGCVSLNELEGEEKDNFLRNLKLVDEISIQQLSRVTGINRGYIHRL
jgi:hypothetical protein